MTLAIVSGCGDSTNTTTTSGSGSESTATSSSNGSSGTAGMGGMGGKGGMGGAMAGRVSISECDDGFSCTVAVCTMETCNAMLECMNGTPLNGDGIGFTNDFCDLQMDARAYVENDTICSNGLF